MSAVAFPIPAEEVTRRMTDAALAETRRVMIERGITEQGVTFEFLTHAVDRLWDDEDREGLRAKAHAMVDDYVDRLFDAVCGCRAEGSR